jgi:hypothetical protein
MDHIALSVTDFDAWLAKLRREGVKVVEQPYTFGDMRAMMIEGPSREALELVEKKEGGLLEESGIPLTWDRLKYFKYQISPSDLYRFCTSNPSMCTSRR